MPFSASPGSDFFAEHPVFPWFQCHIYPVCMHINMDWIYFLFNFPDSGIHICGESGISAVDENHIFLPQNVEEWRGE
jgi:hypothetical protein